MAIREGVLEAQARWERLNKVQAQYTRFETLLDEVMQMLGFQCTALQVDIARYIDDRTINRKMVQAQRGQAKTTIAATNAVHRLIHNPATRVLIFSAGSDIATEIGTLVYQIIHTMPQLACLRPDRSNGDRTSVEAFDVHYSLKGPDKSPSVRTLGITANMQGPRADFLIADDIESSKNSLTALQRERILHLTRDFTSICSHGDILFLGTPQSVDSVYNGLPSRGYTVRIWTGRFPTAEELPNYNDFLAPSIRRALEKNPGLQTGGGPLGDRGQPTDPVLLGEDVLLAKEIDQGAPYFQLQHMLDTKLMDADRYPLKSDKIIFFRAHPDRAPCLLNWGQAEVLRIIPPQDFPIKENYFKGILEKDCEWAPFGGTHMYVDPAGGGKNGDELAYAVTRFASGYVYLVGCGGRPGGLTQANYDWLTAAAVKYKPETVHVEENFGKGAFRTVWLPHLLKAHKCHVEDVWETGQKELRIIDCLEPVIGSGRFVVDEDLIRDDWAQCQQYSPQNRGVYSLFFQLARITRDKGSLVHDDRIDAIAGSVRFWVDRLALDRDKANSREKTKSWKALIKNPLGNGRPLPIRMQGPRDLVRQSGPNFRDKFKWRP